MSTAISDYEGLLRNAVTNATATAPRATDDLIRCSSKAAEAVSAVTNGAAILELAPINPGEIDHPTYQLQLHKAGSEAPASDLGVYSVTAAGYPVMRWYSRKAWEIHPEQPHHQMLNASDLETNFKWLVSNPESRLVVLVTYFQQTRAATSVERT